MHQGRTAAAMCQAATAMLMPDFLLSLLPLLLLPACQVCLSQDRPGFLVNRVLIPMINEAFFCLMEVRGRRGSLGLGVKSGLVSVDGRGPSTPVRPSARPSSSPFAPDCDPGPGPVCPCCCHC